MILIGISVGIVLGIKVIELDRNGKTEIVCIFTVSRKRTVLTYSTVTDFAKFLG